MANLTVTYADMTDAANRLAAGRQEVSDGLQRMQSMIQGLVQGGFVTDSASGVFGSVFEQFTAGALQTISALDGLASFLSHAVQVLESTDEQLGAAIGR